MSKNEIHVLTHRLLQNITHIDEFGFTHEHKSEGLALHYAARKLVTHYDHGLTQYEQHQLAWKHLLEGLGEDQTLQRSVSGWVLCFGRGKV